jgi:predicted transcriptional regulator
MTISDTLVARTVTGTGLRLHWGPIIAGAMAAAALAFVLNTFGLAIGLAVSSAAPTWRDTSLALVFMSGLYLVLVALASYGLGGYIAGRMRAPLDLSDATDFQDGINGLIVWSIATLLAGLIAAATVHLVSRTTAATSSVTTPVLGESVIAYDLDRLFRGGERRTREDLSYDRAEAARILLTTASHTGMDSSDRAYLANLVSADTGLAAADAEHRVDEVAARAKQDISRARSSAVILAFMTGAAALLGAIAAWMAAITGGRYRDGREAIPAFWDWGGTPETERAHSSMPR